MTYPRGRVDPQTRGPEVSSRRSGYASQAILERRRRILVTARKLIATKGIADLGMDEIAERSEVSKRTLYNIFKSRDGLIAIAIHQYFYEYEVKIEYATPAATPERIVEHLSIVCRRNLAVREYTKTLLTAFFSAEDKSDIRNAIFEISAHSHRPWIEKLQAERELKPWIEASDLVEDLVRYRYAVGIDWAYGRLPDERFASTVITGVLTMVRGAAQPRTVKAIDQIIENWERYTPARSIDLPSTVSSERKI